MFFYLIKIIITLTLILVISEISKCSSYIGALLASIPLISVLAMIWLYVDTKDIAKISQLATSVFWLVLASLPLFIVLPVLLKQGINFYISMSVSVVITIFCYWVMIRALSRFNIQL